MKIQISFYSKKILYLYLMKIKISFYFKKMKIQISFVVVLFIKKKNVFSDLLQVLKFKGELNPKRVNQLLNNKLNM